MLLNRQGEASKEERKDEHLSDDNTGGHRRLCSCALLTQDGVEQLELARLYREEAQAAPSKVRNPRHSSMGSIRDPCENPARRDPDPATFVPPGIPVCFAAGYGSTVSIGRTCPRYRRARQDRTCADFLSCNSLAYNLRVGACSKSSAHSRLARRLVNYT